MTQREQRSSTLLVEEATALAWAGVSDPTTTEGPDAFELLRVPPVGDAPVHVRERAIRQGLEQLDTRWPELNRFAERRSQMLLADHRRVREAAAGRGSYSVRAHIPADVIGLFVLLPRVD